MNLPQDTHPQGTQSIHSLQNLLLNTFNHHHRHQQQ